MMKKLVYDKVKPLEPSIAILTPINKPNKMALSKLAKHVHREINAALSLSMSIDN